MQTLNEFQAHRLSKLADRLMTVDVKTRVHVIDDTSELYMVDNQLKGQVPIFYGPISQLPRIFKGEWSFHEEGYYWKEDPTKRTLSSLQEFFGMNYSMVGHIFIPGAQSLRLYGGKILTTHACSREQPLFRQNCEIVKV